MTKRTAHKNRLALEISTLRRLTEDQLELVAGGLKSEMTCAEQGCERRRV